MTLKPLIQALPLFCVLATSPAFAKEDAICNSVNGGIYKYSGKTQKMLGVTPSHQARAADGFMASEQAGLVFNGNGADESTPDQAVAKIVAWGQGDILVAHVPESDEQKAKNEKNPIKFFIQFQEAPYDGPNDLGTKGGVYKVRPQDIVSRGLDSGVLCSDNALTYQHHYIPQKETNGLDLAPKEGDIYCLKTRSGTSYALLQVTNVCEKSVVFNYKYNGNANFFKAESQGRLAYWFLKLKAKWSLR